LLAFIRRRVSEQELGDPASRGRMFSGEKIGSSNKGSSPRSIAIMRNGFIAPRSYARARGSGNAPKPLHLRIRI
jgi:hypothetical protein